MSRSIYWKITIPFILLVLVGMGILGFYMVDSTRNTQINHLETQLTNEARLVAEISLPAFADSARQSELDNIAKTTGKEIQARITLIAKDGTVLGDTDEDPLTLENHATRPEVVAALSSGVGQSTRYSATLHENMMYVAVPVMNQGQILGIARVALPLTAVESSVNSTVMTIVSGDSDSRYTGHSGRCAHRQNDNPARETNHRSRRGNRCGKAGPTDSGTDQR